MKERRPKKARTARASVKSPVVLMERDLELLTLVGLVKYVSTNQLGREFFPTFDRARRRIRDLYDAGYLTITLASSTLPNLISLTRRGATIVAEARPEIAPRLGLAGTIRLPGVRHHLAVVDVRLYAAALGLLRGAPLVRWSNGGTERFKELGFDQHRLVPDGLAEFRTAQRAFAIAVEVDLGTENLGVLARKWTKYRRFAHDGAVDALWVYADAGLARRATIAEQLTAHQLGRWARVLGVEVVRRPVEELPERGESTPGAAREP